MTAIACTVMTSGQKHQGTFADANTKTALALNLAGGLAAPIPGPAGLSKAALATKAGQQQIARQAAIVLLFRHSNWVCTVSIFISRARK